MAGRAVGRHAHVSHDAWGRWHVSRDTAGVTRTMALVGGVLLSECGGAARCRFRTPNS